MSDIFQEVEEDLRREKAKKVWEKYGTYIIAFAVFIVVAVGGWRGYEWYQNKLADEAGARFEDALTLARDGKTAEAEAAFAAIAKESPSGYRQLGQFRAAAEIAKRDAAEGVKAYQALAADGSLAPLLRDLATIRAAMIEVDTKPFAEFLPLVEPLAAPTSAWRHSARELLGLSAYKAKNYTEASKWFLAATSDADVPTNLRRRVEVMLQLIAGEAPPPAGS
jgi:hypothetical protein